MFTRLSVAFNFTVVSIAVSPYQMPKSLGASDNFGHFQSSEKHANGGVLLATTELNIIMLE